MRINLAAGELCGSLRIIARQGPQRQPVLEQYAREFRALVVDPKIVDSDFASFPYPIGKCDDLAVWIEPVHVPMSLRVRTAAQDES